MAGLKPEEKARVEQIMETITEYLKSEPEPTRSGLCIALNITYAQLDVYQHGRLKITSKVIVPELQECITHAVYRINEVYERKLPAACISELLGNQGVMGSITGRLPPFDLGALAKYSK